jgi:hypothetical protein
MLMYISEAATTGKGKADLVLVMKVCWGVEVCGQPHALAALSPGKEVAEPVE